MNVNASKIKGCGIVFEDIQRVYAMNEAEIAEELAKSSVTRGFKLAAAVSQELEVEVKSPKGRNRPLLNRLADALFSPPPPPPPPKDVSGLDPAGIPQVNLFQAIIEGMKRPAIDAVLPKTLPKLEETPDL